MLNMDDKHLMMIEPQGATSAQPVDDQYTKAAEMALRLAQPGRAYKGVHRCICGEISGNTDLILPDGRITNSLLVHYVRWHRDEVPPAELRKLMHSALPYQCPKCQCNRPDVRKDDRGWQIVCPCGLSSPWYDTLKETSQYWLWMHDSLN